MPADNIIHFAIFLRERNAKITVGDIIQVNKVLRGDRFIEAVFGFEVGPDNGGGGAVIQEWIARHIVHSEEGGGGDKPDGY